MTTPENPRSSELGYPYHPETWHGSMDTLTKVVLESELETIPIRDPDTGTDIAVGHLWRVPMYGFISRLDQPLGKVDDNTPLWLGYEDYVPGQRYFGQRPFIAAGLRHPVSRDQRKIRKYGIFEYSIAQGFINEPEGPLPKDWKEEGEKIGDISDPEKRVIAYENLLKMLLRHASLPPKSPIMPPRHGIR